MKKIYNQVSHILDCKKPKQNNFDLKAAGAVFGLATFRGSYLYKVIIFSVEGLMPEKILIVEDEYLSRINMCKYLAGAGYELREAANGAEALELLTRETFNLVITDFVMPLMDGLRLIELIRAK
jgi:PleD family two-component response regulator